MKPTGRTSPSYLVRNPHSYCFRMFVPTDLQPYIGRKELRYSLRTGYVGLAKHKARYLSGQLHLLFKYLRGSVNGLSKLTAKKIPELVSQYIRKSIDQLDELFYDSPDNIPLVNEEDGLLC